MMLDRYRTVFPQYTDHSSLHCLNITNLAGQLVGDCMKNRIWIQEHNKPFTGNHSNDAVKAQRVPFQRYDGFAVIRRAVYDR